MNPTPRARACTAGLAAAALAAGLVGVSGIASASTEPVPSAVLPAPLSLAPDDCLDATTTPASDGNCVVAPVRKGVRLDWAPVAGATGYRVQVGTDSTWSDDPTLTRDVVSSEFTLPVFLPHATYVWRVAALRGAGLGHWSSESTALQPEAQFTRGWRSRVTTLAPANGAVVTAARTTYSWTPVAGASAYELQVSDAPDFTQSSGVTPDVTPSTGTTSQGGPHLDFCYTARTRVTPFMEDAAHAEDNPGACSFAGFPAGTPLYWRVRPLDRFVTAASDVDTTPASTGGISYLPPTTGPNDPEIIAECPGASPSPTATASPSPSATAAPPSGLACGPSHPSELGSWSDVSTYSASPVTPAAATCQPGLVCTTSLSTEPDHVCSVTNVGGADAEKAVCSDLPTLSWGAVAGATRYRVDIGLDDAFSNITRIVETSALSWTPTDSWRDSSPGLSYYYAVQACTASGCGPVTATPPSFRKVTSRPVLGARPRVSGDFTLSWQSYADSLAARSGHAATQDAYAYHVQVASTDHAGYDVLVDEATVDETSYVSASKVYPDGDYVWRVQTVDSAGHRLPWSLSQSFTRDATAPRVTSVSPASQVAVTSPLRVVFSEPVTGVSASTLGLGSGVPVTVAVLDATHATISPAAPLVPGRTYTVTVGPLVKDLSGNAAVAVGPTLKVSTVVDDPSRALHYAGTWGVHASTDAAGRSYHLGLPTSTSHPTVTGAFVGSYVALIGCVGPYNGIVDVYVDGVRRAHVSTYRSFSGCNIPVAAVGGLPRGVQHTVRVVATGTHAAYARGSNVGVDLVNVLS